ncbi:hypothetical protein EFP19_18900 [Burkholderia glumae]|nr:hypothetical protein EFP19_18900 [Burkholderia glumae]
MRFRRRARRGTRPHLDPADGLYSIIDDRGLPTKGKHPAGVVRQYCGNRVCNQSGDCDRQWRSAREAARPPASCWPMPAMETTLRFAKPSVS